MTSSSRVSEDPNFLLVSIGQDRDRDAFSSLFISFSPRVKSYLLRLGVADVTADELTRDIFLLIWRKADQFDPLRASASAWIYTITRNRWVDQLRRAKHPGALWIDLQSSEPATPEDEIRATEGEARLREAIGLLPIEQALVLNLAFFEEFTHVAVANRLNLPLGIVKSRIRLATAYLRSALDRLD